MSIILETIRARASDGQAPAAEAREAEVALAAMAGRETLGATMAAALDLRRQGRIDAAIPLVTRANRTQLDAIQSVQDLIAALEGIAPRPVVLAKYRQQPPFQMGTEEADETLALLTAIGTGSGLASGELVAKLHGLETDQAGEAERLAFLEERFPTGAEDDIAEARALLDGLAASMNEIRAQIVGAVLSQVRAYLAPFGEKTDATTAYVLAKWLYLLVTSPTETRPAGMVEHDEA